MTDQTEEKREPSLSLLIKLMSMTTSTNDAEALVAIRKANKEMAKFPGGTWNDLLSGKVTVIGDPFANLAVPTARQEAPRPRTPPPPRPFTQPRPVQPSTPPWQTHAQQWPRSAPSPSAQSVKTKRKTARQTKHDTLTLDDIGL